MNTNELTEAVGKLLEREEAREAQRRRRTRNRIRRRRKDMESSVSQLMHSVEVIKWCIVGITSVIVLTFVVLVFVVLGIKNEMAMVNAEVQRIQREAEKIRDKIRHPLESVGASLGRRLEGNLSEYLGEDDPVQE